MRLPTETTDTRLMLNALSILRMEWQHLRGALERGDCTGEAETRRRIAACRERVRSDVAYIREDYRDAKAHLESFMALETA
jgi:hypothetical protein